MSPPNLDIGAQKMLESAGYLWSDIHHGYRRKRRRNEPSSVYHHRSPVVIELEELEDHGLVAPNLVPHQRDLALEWRNENPRIRRLKPKRTRQKVAADVRINPGFVSFSARSCRFLPK
jgi:hypothetical protein